MLYALFIVIHNFNKQNQYVDHIDNQARNWNPMFNTKRLNKKFKFDI